MTKTFIKPKGGKNIIVMERKNGAERVAGAYKSVMDMPKREVLNMAFANILAKIGSARQK